jgi:hypothetical protein
VGLASRSFGSLQGEFPALGESEHGTGDYSHGQRLGQFLFELAETPDLPYTDR